MGVRNLPVEEGDKPLNEGMGCRRQSPFRSSAAGQDAKMIDLAFERYVFEFLFP